MSDVITNNLGLWTSALLTKTSAGRGSNGKLQAYGIKKLRELILELAVRGKLEPQDPNDEPASVLLEKIATEKKRLVKEEKLTKQKPLPEVADDEVYFSLPNGWVWSRLGEITNYGIADKAEPEDVDEDTWVLDLEDVEKESSRLLQKSKYSEKPFQSSKNRFAKGDVIYGKLRPYLDKVIVADEDGVCTTEMIPVRGYVGLSPSYLRLVMKTPHFIKYADDSTHGMNLPRLGTDKARMALFPLVPYNEQHRIVAKVDELMALCGQLEQQQTHSIEAHQTLVETLLGTLTRVTSQQDLNEAWTRIANHFDTLFTTEHSIDQLKQTILQLAVMGKLVPQDPNDEPVSVLLEKIVKEKRRLADEGIIKRQQALPEVGDAEIPFQLPEGWEWTRLGNVGLGSTGKTPSTRNPEYYGGEIPFIGPGQITPAGEILESDKSITEEGSEYSVVAEPGDILMVCIGGSIGKSAITLSRIAFNQQINCIRPIFVSPELLNHLMNTPQFQAAVLEKATGSATPIINRSKWEELLVPIPPEAEQHRIVARVDELMALCDALKARIAVAQTTQIHLADAIVEQAVA